MKSLRTLIKLTKQELDNKRRDLNVYLDKKESLEREKQQLLDALEAERMAAAESEDAQYMFTNFLIHTRVQEENLNNAITALEPFIRQLQDAIAELFAEMKKYDILLEKKKQEQADEISRKETIFLSEIALNQHRRKQDETG